MDAILLSSTDSAYRELRFDLHGLDTDREGEKYLTSHRLPGRPDFIPDHLMIAVSGVDVDHFDRLRVHVWGPRQVGSFDLGSNEWDSASRVGSSHSILDAPEWVRELIRRFTDYGHLTAGVEA